MATVPPEAWLPELVLLTGPGAMAVTPLGPLGIMPDVLTPGRAPNIGLLPVRPAKVLLLLVPAVITELVGLIGVAAMGTLARVPPLLPAEPAPPEEVPADAVPTAPATLEKVLAGLAPVTLLGKLLKVLGRVFRVL